MEPWKHQIYSEQYHGKSWRSRKRQIINRTYETMLDNKRLKYRKGDIIKFESGYYEYDCGDWRDWFLTQKDRVKSFRRNSAIPKYAMSEYGVVVNRYKVTKMKNPTFTDYGTIVMMLTGSHPGRLRKFYMSSPYKIISKFPHIKPRGGINVIMKKPFHITDKMWYMFNFNLSSFISNLIIKNGVNELSRNMFLRQIKEVQENNI